MPTYEYGCTACGGEWEEVQRITEPPIEVCPSCGKAAAHRLISAGTGFILKGGGWYSDLYSSAKPASNKAETGAAEGTSAKAEGGTSDASKSDGAKNDGGSKVESASSAPKTTKTDVKPSTSGSSTSATSSSS
jgi:putative FmdB family regulatory protein